MVSKRTLTLPDGSQIEGTDVGVESIRGNGATIVLDDGTEVRAVIDVAEVIRMDGSWDRQGLPNYQIKHALFLTVMEAPESLRRP